MVNYNILKVKGQCLMIKKVKFCIMFNRKSGFITVIPKNNKK